MPKITRDRKASRITPREDGTALVELTRGQFAIIDIEDIPKVCAFKWYAQPARTNSSTFYARYTPKGARTSVPMHRVIFGAGSFDGPLTVDHINRNSLDNRKANLRLATPTIQKLNQNKRTDNTSGVNGVHLRPDGTWQARLAVAGKRVSLGHFNDYQTAVMVQNRVREIVDALMIELQRVA